MNERLYFLPPVAAIIVLLGGSLATAEDGFVLLRAESLSVLPKSKPMLYVRVANATTGSVRARVSIKVPESWRVAKLSQFVELGVGESRRLGFSVADGPEFRPAPSV